jgi:hypothetical protein
MTKRVKVLVVVLMLTVMLPISPAQACACGGTPHWSKMSGEAIVSTVNGLKDEPRIMAAQRGELPTAPAGYQYDANYRLIPLSGSA